MSGCREDTLDETEDTFIFLDAQRSKEHLLVL